MNDTLRFHKTAVVLLSHGTPSSLEEVEAFYTAIRRGRPPSQEQLADLLRRYEAIGGVSPLAAITAAQAQAVRLALGLRAPVAVGNRFTSPSIEEAVAAVRSWGAEHLVAAVLTPQYSSTTTEAYFSRVREAASEDPAIALSVLRDWHDDPALIAFFADEVRGRLESMPKPAKVVFTAHSLPVAAAEGGDPYPQQVVDTARAVAMAAGLDDEQWSQAWQSAGRTDEEWLAPDVRDVIRELAATGYRSVVICPVGFAADNLETLYDLDIEARLVASESGIGMERTRLPNADPAVMASLAQAIVSVGMDGERSLGGESSLGADRSLGGESSLGGDPEKPERSASSDSRRRLKLPVVGRTQDDA